MVALYGPITDCPLLGRRVSKAYVPPPLIRTYAEGSLRLPEGALGRRIDDGRLRVIAVPRIDN